MAVMTTGVRASLQKSIRKTFERTAIDVLNRAFRNPIRPVHCDLCESVWLELGQITFPLIPCPFCEGFVNTGGKTAVRELMIEDKHLASIGLFKLTK